MATTVHGKSEKAKDRPIPVQPEGYEALVAWVKRYRQPLGWGVVLLLVGAGLFGWKLLSTRESERVASTQLSTARFALEAKNYALAASELSRIVANYSGTRSADEASILLAQVRLAQGQSQQAISVLRTFAPKASESYRAQAYGLLGAAYENVAQPREAAAAYQQAARESRMAFLKAGYLSDAGRAWLEAGDTSQARSAYAEIVSKMDSTGAVYEAKLRLGTLEERSAK